MTSEQHDETPGICWPLVRLILATGVTLGGLYQAGQWYAAGYSVAAVVMCGAVVGCLAALYPSADETGPP